VANGGAAEALELEAVTVEEGMEEPDLAVSYQCLAFLLDLDTFHRKDFTLLRNS